MPNMKQSANVDMRGWEEAPNPTAKQQVQTGAPMGDASTSYKNSSMLAPMPLGAATGDAFQRQFYGGTNIPMFRILPAKQGGGA